MALIPCISTGLLPIGQATIIPTANGALSVAHPPHPRPGPKPKPNSQSETVLGSRLISGVNGQLIVRIFASFCLSDSNRDYGTRRLLLEIFKRILWIRIIKRQSLTNTTTFLAVDIPTNKSAN